MIKLNKIAIALASVAVVALPSLAQAVVIDGINVGNGPLEFINSTIMEERVGGGLITGDGQTLHGVGNVTEIRSNGVLVWSPSVGEELTFMFDDYVSTGFSATSVGFTGGTVKFFHDTVLGDGTGANYTTNTGFGDGTLWMDMVGFSFTDLLHPASCTNVTLCGTGVLDATGFFVNGSGFLAVTGAGLADSYFNTNTQGGGADWSLTSSVRTADPAAFTMGVAGGASLITTVPEPTTITLLALGLLGVGFASRKTRAK